MKLAVSALAVLSVFAFAQTGRCQEDDFTALSQKYQSADWNGNIQPNRAKWSAHTPLCSGDIVIDKSECGATLSISDKIIGKCLSGSSPAFSSLVAMCKRNNEENQKLNPSYSASEFPDCDGPIHTGGTFAADAHGPKLLGFIVASKKKSDLGISYQKWVKAGDAVDSDIRSFCDARVMTDPNQVIQDMTRVSGSNNPQEAGKPSKHAAPDQYGESQDASGASTAHSGN